jgi:hypothetical protein
VARRVVGRKPTKKGWSAGFALLLLRFRQRRMGRVPDADAAVGLLNARPVTVYEWHRSRFSPAFR